MVSRLPPKGGRRGNQQITFCRDQVLLAPTAEGRRNGGRSRKLQSPVLPVVQVALGRRRRRRQHGCRGRTRIGVSPSLSAASVVVRFRRPRFTGMPVPRHSDCRRTRRRRTLGRAGRHLAAHVRSPRPWMGRRPPVCHRRRPEAKAQKPPCGRIADAVTFAESRSSRCTGCAVSQPRRCLISLRWKLSRPVYGTSCANCG